MKKLIFLFAVSAILISCAKDSGDAAGIAAPEGQGGSLATFIMKGEYLYVVDERDLNVFNIRELRNPVYVNSVPLGFNIETLFGFDQYLYVGSRDGMFICSLENPEEPKVLSSVQHFTACDPVVANATHAFVTLHSTRFCGNNTNVLEIYDTQDLMNPTLVSSRNLIQPKGLGLYKEYVIVCDDEIKVFDVSNPAESKFVNSIPQRANDVIIRGSNLIAIGDYGLYQYAISDTESGPAFTELSAIPLME